MENIGTIIESQNTQAEKIILVNDRYDHQFGIKDDEHDKHNQKYAESGNIFPRPHHIFPKPSEFNRFFLSD